jgi:hypothetical protein
MLSDNKQTSCFLRLKVFKDFLALNNIFKTILGLFYLLCSVLQTLMSAQQIQINALLDQPAKTQKVPTTVNARLGTLEMEKSSATVGRIRRK